MRILVTGSRTWTDEQIVRETLFKAYKLGYDSVPTIVHGACRGADSIAGEVAKDLGWNVEEFPAQWDLFGKMAGPRRNQEMIDTNPDLVIVFHGDLFHSKGTLDMVKRAIQAKKEVWVISCG